jgi:hypothetical protein
MAVPHRIDASVERLQMTTRDESFDHSRGHTALPQLPPRHDPVLRLPRPRQHGPDRLKLLDRSKTAFPPAWVEKAVLTVSPMVHPTIVRGGGIRVVRGSCQLRRAKRPLDAKQAPARRCRL